ncbi:MAG: trigger factor [Clostridium sp.]|nr:trigger factor [Acetatifactor muris]MCM1526350.1 trigger factor [Bacteroides sp.]MCM1563982.1 trigger factor [Clostridium sp.]
MKKRKICLLALAMGAMLICGCGNDDAARSGEESGEESLAPEISSGSVVNASDYVTLGEYKGLQLDMVPEVIEDLDVEIEMKQFYFAYVTTEEGITDRPVELMDMTNIDYEGKKDGVAFSGGTAQGANLLIGSGQFIEGFEEGLIGVMPGETVDLNLTFPAGYQNAELAGQDVVFTVTVNFIPEMQDERVGELGIPGVTTLEGLQTYVRDFMEEQAHSDYLTAAGDAIMTQLVENCVFAEELPEDMVASNRQLYALMLDANASYYGMTGEAYAQMFGMDYEAMLDESAQQYTKEVLAVRAIADKEGLNISDESLDERLQEYAESAGVTVDDLLVSGLTKENFRDSLLYEDVLDFLLENSETIVIIGD